MDLNASIMKEATMERFDTRIPQKEKELFKFAAALSGYTSLAAFVLHAAKAEAEKVIEKHNSILSSEKDREVFFDIIMNPSAPNKSLKKAAQKHAELLNSRK